MTCVWYDIPEYVAETLRERQRRLALRVDRCRQRGRHHPLGLTVKEHDRNDRRQRSQLRRIRPRMAFPDPDHIGRQLQGQTRIGVGLVLKQRVDKRFLAGLQRDPEQQVALAPGQSLVHEPALQGDRQYCLVQQPGDVVGQMIAQKSTGAPGIGQQGLKKSVMRRRQRRQCLVRFPRPVP